MNATENTTAPQMFLIQTSHSAVGGVMDRGEAIDLVAKMNGEAGWCMYSVFEVTSGKVLDEETSEDNNFNPYDYGMKYTTWEQYNEQNAASKEFQARIDARANRNRSDHMARVVEWAYEMR